MATVNDAATASGWLKQVYGEVNDLMPDGVKLLRYIKFDKQKELGREYSEPAWLGGEQGFTYNTGNSNGGYTLAAPIAAVSQEMKLAGSEIQLRSRVDVKQFWTAYGGGQKSFGDFYKRLIANMTYAHKRRREISALHGSRSIGASTTGGITGSSTTRAIVITASDWAPGIWAGAKNMEIDYSTDAATVANSNAAIVVTSVVPSTRTVNVSGNATDLTALTTAEATAKLYFRGSLAKEQAGLVSIAANTSGTYANIAAGTYDLWQGNPITVSGDLTWDKIQDGIEQSVGRGLEDDIVLLCALPVWSNLNSDLNTLRRIDSGYSIEKNKLGQKTIEFISMNGSVRVEPSIYMKGGEAVAFPLMADYHARIGSVEQTFEIPGTGQYFLVNQDTSSVEFRAFSDEAVLMRAPNKCIAYSSIVSS